MIRSSFRKGLLFFTLLLVCFTSSAEDFKVGDFVYVINADNQTVTLLYAYDISGAVSIPESVEYKGVEYRVTIIGEQAFVEHEEITEVSIPNTVTTIGNAAFCDCVALQSISIPNSVTSIGDMAFHGCKEATSINLGNAVKYIGSEAFAGCKKLGSITIPESLTAVGFGAFSGCGSLTNVDITNLAKWCSISFHDGGGNPLINAQHLYLNGEEIKDLVVPDEIHTIGAYAFYGYMGLTSVTIPKTTTTIGAKAFTMCRNLENIVIDENNPNYDSRDNCNAVIETETNTLLVGCKNSTIPNSITAIGPYAFEKCFGMTEIAIPESVTRIWQYAFLDCYYLKYISIPKTMNYIGYCAFANNSSSAVFYCYAFNPPKGDIDTFLGANGVLHVPRGQAQAYKNSFVWYRFYDIVDDIDLQLDPGDVNGDENVNVSDIATLVNMILGTDIINNITGDVNGDGRVNVSDVSALINLILGIKN